MTSDKFNYQMCPIRQFQTLITYIDASQNFIFASDLEGKIGIFLINENDLENDEDSMQVEVIETPGIHYLKYIEDRRRLIFVTFDQKIHSYEIEQLAEDKFLIQNKTSLEFQIKADNLYVNLIGTNKLLISNLLIQRENFHSDQTVYLYDIEIGEIAFKQTFNFKDLSEVSLSYYFQQIYNQGMQNNLYQNFIEQRNSHQLAIYHSEKLLLQLYSNQLLLVDTQKPYFKDICSNYQLAQQPYNNIDTPIAINMTLIKGFIVTFNLDQLNVLEFQSLKHLQSIQFNTPMYSCLFQLQQLNNQLNVYTKDDSSTYLYQYDIDVKSQNFLTQKLGQRLKDSIKKINDIDMNNFIIASATNQNDIQLFRIKDLSSKPLYLNAGSRSVKSYRPHPLKVGVNMIKLTKSKIIAVLGNLIRVYSFDLKQQ